MIATSGADLGVGPRGPHPPLLLNNFFLIPWMIEMVDFIQTSYSKNIKDPQNAGNRISDGLNFKIAPLYQIQ